MAVLSKRAIEEFLYERELADSSVVKDFTERAIDAKLEAAGVQFYGNKPRLHQKATILLCLKYPAYLIFLDPGLGKTLCALITFAHRKRHNRAKRMIVLVPNSVNLPQWGTQIQTHTPHISYALVNAEGRDAREELMFGDEDIVVITYMGFLALVSKGKPVLDDEGKKTDQTKGWTLDEKKLKKVFMAFDFGTFDESTAFKNGQSYLTRTLKKLATRLTYRYAMTGTPHGRKVEDLWSQFDVIDEGETLGETIGLFRAAFFKEKQNYFSGFPDYVFDDRKMELLQQVIRHRSIRYRDDECLDLPAQNRSVRQVVLPEENWAYYDRLREDMKEARGNFKLIDNAFMRARQLCSGYLTMKLPSEDEDLEPEKVQIKFKSNPKLDALLEWIEEIPLDRKIVVFHEFIISGEVICEALKKLKIKHSRLWSGQKDKGGQVEKFLTNPDIRVMVSSSSGALGGNWQVANYMAFYETPVDPIIREQEERRIYRMGQPRPCFYVDFVVTNSVEEKIMKYLKEGKNLRDHLIDDKLVI